jgi:hypothetical protein
MAEDYNLMSENHLWTHNGQPVVPLKTELLRQIVHHYHDTTTVGHPGAASTLLAIAKDYWWPKNERFYESIYQEMCDMPDDQV